MKSSASTRPRRVCPIGSEPPGVARSAAHCCGGAWRAGRPSTATGRGGRADPGTRTDAEGGTTMTERSQKLENLDAAPQKLTPAEAAAQQGGTDPRRPLATAAQFEPDPPAESPGWSPVGRWT